jgi:hypothetical protein
MGRTYEALLRAERARVEVGHSSAAALSSETIAEWTEDLAALRVAVYALEDRMERELPALVDELREAIGKAERAAREQAGGCERAPESRLDQELAGVRAGIEQLERHGWRLAGLVCALAVLVVLC